MMKKLVALILAVVMVMAMGSVAFAEDYGATNSTSNTITFTKKIEVYNDDSSLTKVYGPGITYTYTIAPAGSGDEGALLNGKTITDTDGTTTTVRKGISAGVTFTDSTAEFLENASVNLSSGRGTMTDNLVITVDPSKFPAAGVYRYIITEADNTAAMTTAGLTRGDDYITTRYLDIYMKNNGENREVMGYVMFVTDSSDTTIDGQTSNKSTITGKTTGFEEIYDPTVDGTSDTDGEGLGDKYYTYNYTVTKVIDGNLADKTHPFPFVVATDTAVAGHQFTAVTTSTGSVTGISSGVAAIGTDIGAGLSNNQTITLQGLPANTAITVTETNDTTDAYTVTIVDATKGSIVAATSTAAGANQTTGSQAITNYIAYNTPNVKPNMTNTTVTNTLEDISLTGVVMRVAPYMLILAAGMTLLLISRRRKAEEE